MDNWWKALCINLNTSRYESKVHKCVYGLMMEAMSFKGVALFSVNGKRYEICFGCEVEIRLKNASLMEKSGLVSNKFLFLNR